MSNWLNFARVASIAALGVYIFAAPNASAQFGNCREDLRTHCSDVSRSDDRAVLQCLSEHRDQLSDACRAQIETQSGVRQSRRQACRADVAEFCADINKRDRRAVTKCLMEHESEIAEQCRASLARGE